MEKESVLSSLKKGNVFRYHNRKTLWTCLDVYSFGAITMKSEKGIVRSVNINHHYKGFRNFNMQVGDTKITILKEN